MRPINPGGGVVPAQAVAHGGTFVRPGRGRLGRNQGRS
jgi:hypothetical protein